MSTGSSIEWTNATWNPVVGCTRASAGCDHCYAVTMTHRLEAMGQAKYAGLTVLNKNGDRHFNGVVRTVEDALKIPFGWRKPRKVFVNSMSDLFHRDVPFEFVDRVFAVMALTPQHTYQVLTKRPERMAEYFAIRRKPELHVWNLAWNIADWLPTNTRAGVEAVGWHRSADHVEHWPLPNVWLGASVEDQQRADERIPHLLKVPAAVRFLSCEPLLGPVNLRLDSVLMGNRGGPVNINGTIGRLPGIDWVIVGGESGGGARPFVLGWAKDLVRQCRAAGVPIFVKQVGAHPTNREGQRCPKIKDPKGGNPSEWPEELRVREMPGTASPVGM